MNNSVGINSQELDNRVFKFYGIFGNIINTVDSKKYKKTHMFNNNELTKSLKQYLYNVNNMSKKEDLIKNFGEEWTLKIVDGFGDYNNIDYDNKVFTLYYDDFEKFYEIERNIKKNASTITDLFDNDKIPNSNNVTNIINQVSKRSSEIIFSDDQKNILSNCIPDILINNHIKLEKHDVFDINKMAIQEVIEIGRGILEKNKKYANKLGVSNIAVENAWQKYFEKYGSYLLFGNVKLSPQECLDKTKTKSLNDKYPDLITCNRYGFLDLIELKKSDMYLFKYDDSHHNFVPTSELSSAISQLNNYLQIIPYAYKTKNSQDKGLQCATGMILIGDNKHLVKPSKSLTQFCLKNNLDEDKINFMAHLELRKLNYSYSYIQVVLYDELIDNLENFINAIK